LEPGNGFGTGNVCVGGACVVVVCARASDTSAGTAQHANSIDTSHRRTIGVTPIL
jgi:hypothetical protein